MSTDCTPSATTNVNSVHSILKNYQFFYVFWTEECRIKERLSYSFFYWPVIIKVVILAIRISAYAQSHKITVKSLQNYDHKRIHKEFTK
jgi:hypothetical protein